MRPNLSHYKFNMHIRRMCVCVVPLATCKHIRILRHIVGPTPLHITPGSHECGESGRATGRVQAFSFVAIKVLVYDFFLAGGATNPHPFVAKPLSRSLSPLANQELTKTDTISTAVYRPFTFHCSVSGYISGGRCDHRPCTRIMTYCI